MNPLAMIGLWIFVALVLLLKLGWTSLVSWADANPNMASWVQAIGSIVAIAAAGISIYWTQTRQERRQTQAEDARKRDALKLAFQLVHGASDTIKQICDDDFGTGPGAIDLMTLRGQFDGLADAMRKVDLAALGSYNLIEAVVTTDAVIRKMSFLLQSSLMRPQNLLDGWTAVIGESITAYQVVNLRAITLNSALKH